MGRARFGAWAESIMPIKIFRTPIDSHPAELTPMALSEDMMMAWSARTIANGAFLRGRFELIYNLELTIPISDQQFYVILFADAGNAYLTKKDIHLTKGYKRSFGPGFRILIPMVGIMGFDFGYALDGP